MLDHIVNVVSQCYLSMVPHNDTLLERVFDDVFLHKQIVIPASLPEEATKLHPTLSASLSYIIQACGSTKFCGALIFPRLTRRHCLKLDVRVCPHMSIK